MSFVIPVLNDAAGLRRCLGSIAASARGFDVEVIVADNGSIDGSADVARSLGARVLSLPGVRLGELRNRAAAVARGAVLAFVDADHEIDPGWVPAAIETLADPSVGGAGAPCRPPEPGTGVQRLYDGLRRHVPGSTGVEWLGSGNMAVRKAAFDEAGGFDPSLETCEDVDLCRRIRARGLTLVSDSRLGNVHYGDPRTLRDVFAGELWRGRDNLRVSLRAPRSPRTLASAAIPVLNLTAAGAGLLGLLTFTTTGAVVAGGALVFLPAMVGLRAAIMTWPAEAGRSDRTAGSAEAGRTPSLIRDLPQAFAVAAAYEAGRALAMVARAGHGRRRAVEPARGTA